jgi:hypothetical protein
MVCASMGAILPNAVRAGSDSASSAVVSQDGKVKLRVSADKSTVRVAEPIRFQVEVEAPRGSRVELPKLAGRVGGFEVRTSERIRDVPTDGFAATRRWLVSAVLETLKTGDVEIPAIQVQYALDAKATSLESLTSKPLHVRVVSVLEDRADPRKFRDVAGTIDLPIPTRRSYSWLWWTGAGGGALIVAGLITMFVLKRRAGLHPYEWALHEIGELERVPIQSAADSDAVFNELVRVIREFFELEFDVPVASSTSREFLRAATKQVGLNEACRKKLAWLASIADEMKFARLSVGEKHVREAFTQAKAFLAECDAHRRASEQEAA